MIDKIKSLHYRKEDYKIYVSSESNDYMGPQTKNQAETLALHYHYFDRHNLSYHQRQGRHHGFRRHILIFIMEYAHFTSVLVFMNEFR